MRGNYYIQVQALNEPGVVVAQAWYSEAAIAAMHGVARVCIAVSGGWVFVWDAAKTSTGPIAGAVFGDTYWFPWEEATPLIEEGTLQAQAPKVAGIRDWFQEWVHRVASAWWRR